MNGIIGLSGADNPAYKHGHALRGKRSVEWKAWVAMNARCKYPSHSSYRNYGGRGIKVCPEWQSSFESFFKDVGCRPGEGYSLDRIDVNGNYEPGNVRWATEKEQHRNQRGSRLVTIQGVTKCVADWAESGNVSAWVIRDRLNNGWTAEEAVKTPLRKYRGRNSQQERTSKAQL